MILKMSALTFLHIALTFFLWKIFHNKTLKIRHKILIGVVYGITACLSTHFGVMYGLFAVNVRDISPLAAGMFFDPVSGIIAGLIGGIERYIAGTYLGVGTYTCIACSISTTLAGFLAAALNKWVFKGKIPSGLYAFFMGAVMEVFHMYSVFLTHREDMSTAFYVVRTCAIPMIVFTGIGVSICAVLIRFLSKDETLKLRYRRKHPSLSSRFQGWLFLTTFVVLTGSFFVSFSLQTNTAVQNSHDNLWRASDNIISIYNLLGKNENNIYEFSYQNSMLSQIHVGSDGSFDFINDMGYIPVGDHRIYILSPEEKELLKSHKSGEYFSAYIFGVDSSCLIIDMDSNMRLLVTIPLSEVYAGRDQQGYETAFADIILFAVIFVVISFLVEKIIVSRLDKVNVSLDKITQGDLDEKVRVYDLVEFSRLSEDINQMVNALKAYFEEARQRIAKELQLAHNIQEAALPKNFDFPDAEYRLYATMNPAKEVGGDFYDFFLVDQNRVALVIADVSGKGIPAAMFMMRSKTAIRSFANSFSTPSEILYHANNTLCEGNDAEMFTTAWIGIIDMNSGLMTCSNAGHEYPVIMRAGGEFELLKDKHGLVLAAMEGTRFKEYEVQFEPGDRLFVYTDGVPEAVNKTLDQYGTDRLVQILNETRDLDIKEVLPAVLQNIQEFAMGVDQFDDITMLEFVFKPDEQKDLIYL